jgi:hypothetical protein
MQTEFEFTLPQGYVDESGRIHRHGLIRRAVALDEIEPMRDPRVRNNESYLPVLLLSRVVTRLGNLPEVTPTVMERLFAADMAYLADLYLRLNSPESITVGTSCPHCHHPFHVEVAPMRGNGSP